MVVHSAAGLSFGVSYKLAQLALGRPRAVALCRLKSSLMSAYPGDIAFLSTRIAKILGRSVELSLSFPSYARQHSSMRDVTVHQDLFTFNLALQNLTFEA